MSEFSLANHVLQQEVANETVLLDTFNGQYFELNETGSFMLNNLLNSQDINTTTQTVAHHYTISMERAMSDLLELLEILQSRDLLVTSSPLSRT